MAIGEALLSAINEEIENARLKVIRYEKVVQVLHGASNDIEYEEDLLALKRSQEFTDLCNARFRFR